MILDEPPMFTALCDEHPLLRVSLAHVLRYCPPCPDARFYRSARLADVAMKGRALFHVDAGAVVAAVCASRADFLRSDAGVGLEPFTGRIIAYWWQYTLSDGCSPIETNEFLDVDDCPPWDTWIGIVPKLRAVATRANTATEPGQALLAWVPPPFVDGCQRAMEVNSTNCIRWIEDVRWR